MSAKKINLNKITSYLLIFTVFFTLMQTVNLQKASATDETQVKGLQFHIGDVNGKTKNIDGNEKDGYVCEFLPIGQNFTLVADSGYSIVGVESSNPSFMNVKGIANSSGGKDYVVNTITDYSDFTLTVTMKDSSGKQFIYPIKMKFESDSSLSFGTLRVTLDGKITYDLLFTQTDENGNYHIPDINSDVKMAKVQLFDNNKTPMNFSANGGSSAAEATVNLTGGDNVISIAVTNQNISRQYKLIITKKGEAKLQSLVPSAGTLSPAFNSSTYDYTLQVPTTQTTIAFTPTAVDNSSTIKVNGVTVKSGSRSQSIKLDEGENDVEVIVTTKDGDTNTYNIEVTRTALFRSSQLTGLTLTSGTLTPAFNKGVYEYSGTVDNSITSIGVTPTAEDVNATITVNGKKVPSGATSPYISLDEGGNTINVKVTDSKGNSNTYVLNITRRYPKDNVNLASLSVTDGKMSPKFDPETYLYSVKVARNIEKVRVMYTSQNDKAKIKINGKEYTNGQSDYIKLDIGANLVVVEVTAEDGKTTTTYKLSVIRGDIEGSNQWVLVGGNWTFYNAAGMQIKNQWVKYDNQWYFLDINGYMQTGWIQDSGNWYYLNKDGIMQTGWFYDKGYWYYLEANGAMRVNTWATYDGKWYYFNNFGEMQTAWAQYKGKWYLMDDHGVMQKGWVTYDRNKYYLNDDGSMRTGWLYNGKSWYYLDDSGIMITGWKNINGKNYYFDAGGVMKTGMLFLDGQWINLNNA
ncbi:cadherin-like beta sandwich domain-containing protein [Clostridium beijerinckii]|uniref:cadherin-like beta sandwich domain-containing protein n=1 Tax=Clostridium beijerinckii TaxID=1520 RepID=UPI001570F098|nr:cadherin-like beta sandwich domain-containing protein [Clostridium beijerinckii]NRT74147.1 glucan-binding YG repeat protein [Clostridium beijerinckii]